MTENEREIIENEAHEHKYFHKMLNMAEDDLDPFEYRLLAHYVRWSNLKRRKIEGYRKTAKLCKMSPAKVLQARQSLIERGYIKHIPPTAEQANKGIGGTVVIVDRWLDNIQRYSQPGSKIDQVDNEPGLNMNHKKESSTGKKEDKNLSSLKNATGDIHSHSKEIPTPQPAKTKTKDPQPPVARAPLPPKKPREQNPVYNAVAEYIFCITDKETLDAMQEKESAATRIGIIASWLNGKTDTITYGKASKFVGFITGGEVKPEHIKKFAAWYALENKTASMVKDGEKFVEYWRKWASSQRKQAAPRPPAPAAPSVSLTPEQLQQRQNDLKTIRNGVKEHE